MSLPPGVPEPYTVRLSGGLIYDLSLRGARMDGLRCGGGLLFVHADGKTLQGLLYARPYLHLPAPLPSSPAPLCPFSCAASLSYVDDALNAAIYGPSQDGEHVTPGQVRWPTAEVTAITCPAWRTVQCRRRLRAPPALLTCCSPALRMQLACLVHHDLCSGWLGSACELLPSPVPQILAGQVDPLPCEDLINAPSAKPAFLITD